MHYREIVKCFGALTLLANLASLTSLTKFQFFFSEKKKFKEKECFRVDTRRLVFFKRSLTFQTYPRSLRNSFSTK